MVIGADGSAGISSRHVGVTFDQQDLGLEVELAATEADRAAWRGRVLLDWGPVPGSYGWVFPKDDELTVGVIMAKGQGAETKQYLTAFLAQLGLADREVRRDSGHLTRCRRPTHRCAAAGCSSSGTPPGCSSRGPAKGSVTPCARARGPARSPRGAQRPSTATRPWSGSICFRRWPPAGGCTALFGKHPHLMHAAMATPLGWRAFESFCRGELSMANVVRRPSIGALISLFGGRAVTPAPT